MKKLWVKMYLRNRLIKNQTVEVRGEIDEDGFFTDLLGTAGDTLAEICNSMDIENPIWFDSNREEFQQRHKTTFRSGNFMEKPEFDRLEIEIIE